MMIRWSVLSLFGLACTPDDFETETYAELRTQGVDRYLGAFCPSEHTTDEAGIEYHAFPADQNGPMCLYGADFHTMTRDQGHEDLVFFLQGGGLCYSELCIAISSGGAWFPKIDLLDTEVSYNPVRDWNQVYVPYCDGSLFAGDADIDDDGDGLSDRFHRGLMNLSAAMDVASNAFPHPQRILLAGSSGGGYGTIPATVLARWTWPNADLYVFNDSGVGLGLADNDAFLLNIIDELGASSILPESIHHEIEGGHLVPMVEWQLEQDPKLKVSAFSYNWDYVISQIYLGVSYGSFEDWLKEETAAVHEAFPKRYQRFIPEGSRHTTLLGDPSGFVSEDSFYYDLVEDMLGGLDTTAVGDMTVGRWIEAFVNNGSEWTSRVE